MSTLTRSPSFTNSGTCTTAPVSSVAALVTFETVSPLTPGLGLRDHELDRGRQLQRGRHVVEAQQLRDVALLEVGDLVGDGRVRQRHLLVVLDAHEDVVGAVVVQVLHVLGRRLHARHRLACAERALDDLAGVDRLELRAHERAALAGLHVLELDDAPGDPVDPDMHAVLELVGADRLGHRSLVDPLSSADVE